MLYAKNAAQVSAENLFFHSLFTIHRLYRLEALHNFGLAVIRKVKAKDDSIFPRHAQGQRAFLGREISKIVGAGAENAGKPAEHAGMIPIAVIIGEHRQALSDEAIAANMLHAEAQLAIMICHLVKH